MTDENCQTIIDKINRLLEFESHVWKSIDRKIWKLDIPTNIRGGDEKWFETKEEANKWAEENIPSEEWHHASIYKDITNSEGLHTFDIDEIKRTFINDFNELIMQLETCPK